MQSYMHRPASSASNSAAGHSELDPEVSPPEVAARLADEVIGPRGIQDVRLQQQPCTVDGPPADSAQQQAAGRPTHHRVRVGCFLGPSVGSCVVQAKDDLVLAILQEVPHWQAVLAAAQ